MLRESLLYIKLAFKLQNANNMMFPFVYNKYYSNLLLICYSSVTVSKQRMTSSYLMIATGLHCLLVLELPWTFQMCSLFIEFGGYVHAPMTSYHMCLWHHLLMLLLVM